VKDQVAFLKRLVQDIPRDTWHRTQKELKLPDGSISMIHVNNDLRGKHLNTCSVDPAVA
jgi:hypothetical protein